jgi:hypothetical protein
MTINAEAIELTSHGDHVSLRGVPAKDVLVGLELLESVRIIQARYSDLSNPALIKTLMAAMNIDPVPTATLSQSNRLAKQRNALLVTGAHTYDSLAQLRGAATVASVRTAVSRQRDRGEVFTVLWEGRTLLPAFQFDDEGRPRPELKPLITELKSADLGEWAMWTWLTEPSAYLSGDVPEQVAGHSPDRALNAVRRFCAPRAA